MRNKRIFKSIIVSLSLHIFVPSNYDVLKVVNSLMYSLTTGLFQLLHCISYNCFTITIKVPHQFTRQFEPGKFTKPSSTKDLIKEVKMVRDLII